jgi:hypothetical protein
MGLDGARLRRLPCWHEEEGLLGRAADSGRCCVSPCGGVRFTGLRGWGVVSGRIKQQKLGFKRTEDDPAERNLTELTTVRER